MKKIITLIALGLQITFSSYAQESKFFYEMPYSSRNSGSYDKSASLLSVGYGLGTTITDNFGNKAINNPIWDISLAGNIKYEKAAADEFGIGVNLAYTLFSVKDNLESLFLPQHPKMHVFNIGAMAYYHFNKLIPIERLDMYMGLGVSYRYIYRTEESRRALGLYGMGDNETMVFLNAKLGARYYIGNSFGFYGEVGYDAMSVMNIGVTVSLGDKILGAKSKLKKASKEEIEDSDNNEEDEEMERPAKNKKVKKTRN